MTFEYPTLVSSFLCDDEPVLRSVRIHGELEGLLLKTTITQSFRNESRENMEVTYTFPLAWGAVLLGLEATIAGKHRTGKVLSRERARDGYEKAIEDGDAPVMVEQSEAGTLSMAIGSIKPGEDAIIELILCQMLDFDHGQIRLVIPTTIAPRYGNAQEQAGLTPDQTPEPSVFSEHKFELSLDLKEFGDQAQITSPSHTITQQHSEGIAHIALYGAAWLDRDFVLLIQNMEGMSFALAGPDPASGREHAAVIASFCPTHVPDIPAPLNLKILIDCSGSMAGESIRQTRVALQHLAKTLQPTDTFSFSRFGGRSEHILSPSPATDARRRALLAAIERTDASLGGTELFNALTETFAIDMRQDDDVDHEESSVLLITDGAVWDAQHIVDAARQSGHRIYAVGVGSAPADSLLREVALTTSGACEAVSPREDMSAAMERLVKKMRLTRPTVAAVKSDTRQLWTSPVPRRLANRETVHMFMRLGNMPDHAPSIQIDGQACTAKALQIRDDDLVARLVAARQVSQCEDVQQKAKLALQYQLLTPFTNLLLVVERDAADKTDGMPSLHQVRPMHAAGAGAMGSFAFDDVSFLRDDFYNDPNIKPIPAPEKVQLHDNYDMPAFLRRSRIPEPESQQRIPPAVAMPLHPSPDQIESHNEQIIQAFNASAVVETEFRKALRAIKAIALTPKLQAIFDALSNRGLNTQKVWACYLQWIHLRACSRSSLSSSAISILKKQIDQIPEEVVTACLLEFDKLLAHEFGAAFLNNHSQTTK